jgi:hypothetical protein
MSAQAIKCPNCKNVVSIMIEPDCYRDLEWLNEVYEYSKKGYLIEVVKDKNWEFGCKCEDKL